MRSARPAFMAKKRRRRVVAVRGGTYAAPVATSYFLKKYNVHIWKMKLWMVPQIYQAKPHIEGAIHNLRYCR